MMDEKVWEVIIKMDEKVRNDYEQWMKSVRYFISQF
jgi:hypothetical protein